mmetsp:Transcript_9293/g.20935  ORF Transcript_9293/g.20935 Transcript_9293/m.20935 type:complete len:105 (+) Transcript_9293:233-547(+)
MHWPSKSCALKSQKKPRTRNNAPADRLWKVPSPNFVLPLRKKALAMTVRDDTGFKSNEASSLGKLHYRSQRRIVLCHHHSRMCSQASERSGIKQFQEANCPTNW